jgi:hypothetical protein
MPTLNINEEQVLSLIDQLSSDQQTQIMIKLLQSKQEIFKEIILDAIEEVGLANSIIEGRNNEFVPEEEIFDILDNKEI